MKTLLDIFFKPYLKFLLKFNLIAFAAFFVIIISGVQEVIRIAPFLYFFGMYSTNNRHQFKDNISWMMASFSKKTLLGYHLLSQSMILFIQIILLVGVSVGFIASVIYFVPESSQMMPKAISILSSPEIKDSLIDTKNNYFSRKESLVSFIAFVFFLITMYSPISMKDYLKSVEQKNSKHRYSYLFISLLLLTFLLTGADIDLKDYLLLVLSAIVVGEFIYLGYIYNKVFILVHPKQFPKVASMALVSFLAFSYFNYAQSLHYFRNGKDIEGRFQELIFLGSLAPKLDAQYFDREFSSLKHPDLLVQLLRIKRYKNLISEDLLAMHFTKTEDFSIAIDLLKALPTKRAKLLSEEGVWDHLNELLLNLHKKNQASAFWMARVFHKELVNSNWKPNSHKMLSETSALEQIVTLAWYKKNDPKHYGELLSQGMNPLVEEIYLGKNRSPASLGDL